jgi:zinc finger protein
MAHAGSSDEWRAPPPSAPGSRPHQNEEYATVAVVDGEEFDITAEAMVMESVCPECHEDGTTKMQVQPVAFFHEMMVSSFECHSCGHKNVLVQPVGDIQETGVRCQLTVTCAEDLNREVVKGKDATVSIADLGFEIPPQTQSGTLSTVEGVLSKAVDGLRQTANAIAESDPENAAKIREFLGRLVLYTIADEMVLPFTIVLDDPTGNSFVQNFEAPAVDPQLVVENYTRTDAQNKSLLILSDEQMYAETRDAEASGATTGGNRSKKKTLAEKVGGLVSEEAVVSMYHGAKNSARLPCACPECRMPGENRMCITAIPHFAEIILMCFVCEHCGAKDAEVKHGGVVPKLGRRLTLTSAPETHDADFSRDILKSEFARIEIPELGLEMNHGTLGGIYTTVEGLLTQMRDQLIGTSGRFCTGDSADAETKKNWLAFVAKLDALMSGEIGFTLVVEDPMAASWIHSELAPAADPQIAVVDFERTEDDDASLGIDCFATAEDVEADEVDRYESGGGAAAGGDADLSPETAAALAELRAMADAATRDEGGVPGGAAVEQPVMAGEFDAAESFAGAREGWVFKRGTRGLGYYRDRR